MPRRPHPRGQGGPFADSSAEGCEGCDPEDLISEGLNFYSSGDVEAIRAKLERLAALYQVVVHWAPQVRRNALVPWRVGVRKHTVLAGFAVARSSECN